MSKFKVGDVVIVSTNQAGTIYNITENEIVVFLANHDIWYGQEYEVRIPSNKKELKQCILDLPKWGRNG